MWIFVFLATVLSQMQDEQQLTNAACVIFSRFYLQNNQELAGRAIGDMIQSQGITKEDAILFSTAALVEQCLDTITKQETMEIITSLQSQQLGLDGHKHLVEKADLKKYGSKKKSSKKNEILKVIKQIDDMIMQQKKEFEGDDGNEPQQQQDGGKKRQRKNKSQDLPDLSLFDIKEWVVLSSFALVGVLLSYIICCVPEKKKKDKKKKVKQEEVQEQKIADSDEQEILESKEKQD